MLTSSDGALIPLSQVAEIKLQTGESMINREMNHRYLLVKLDYHDRDPLSAGGGGHQGDRAKGVIRSRANITSNGAASSRGSSAPRRASS